MRNDDELSYAINEFFDQLPPQMIELALEAVKLQEKLEETQDEQTRYEIQRELEMINHEIILSAGDDYSGLN